MDNSSIFTADRMTHLKIVAVSLICAAIVAGIGKAARVTDGTMTSKARLDLRRLHTLTRIAAELRMIP